MWSRSAEEERRRFRMILGASAGAHVLVILALVFAPASSARLQPTVVTVDLVSAASFPDLLPVDRPKPRARPKPRPRKIVVPKQAPKAERKPRPARVEELDYDEALAQLREELGEEPELQPAPEVARASAPPASGEPIDPEVAAWMLATRRHVRSAWVTPPEFMERSLRTVLAVQVRADGRVLGEPEVLKASGDPFWDDNAVRAVLRANPLPPPPVAGEWQISFTPRAVQR